MKPMIGEVPKVQLMAAKGGLRQRLDPFGVFVKFRVLALGGMFGNYVDIA